MSKTGLAKLQKTIEYRFGWDDAMEAAAHWLLNEEGEFGSDQERRAAAIRKLKKT